ncbi:MAG: glycosyltransferase [Firmicutes bacterium]|nr:glycosyltransferase [Bacillota bacterium]
MYNAEKYIEKCLLSVASQTYGNLEIVVVNDGSTDNSLAVVSEFAKADNRIVVINKENGGVASARNAGLDVAIGDYIAFVDSDDYIDSKMYEKLFEAIQNNSADTAFCGFVRVIGDRFVRRHEANIGRLAENPQNIASFFEIKGLKSTSPDSEFTENTMGSTCRVLFNRKLIESSKLRFPQDIFIAEDLVFLLNYLLLCKKVSVVNENLYYYLCNPVSATSKRYKKNYLENEKALYGYITAVLAKNSFLTAQQKSTLLSKFKLLSCSTIVRNELGYNEAGIARMRKLAKCDKYFRGLLPFPSLFLAQREQGFKKAVFFLLIKFRCWGTVKSFLLRWEKKNA